MPTTICRHLAILGLACLLTPLPACTRLVREPSEDTPRYADLPPVELREVLADLANAHAQKMELAFYVSLPWKGVDAPFKEFYPRMSKRQGDLSEELHAWAKKHDVDLTYSYGKDTMGRAVKIMEARQSKALQADKRVDFERDTLIQMYTDYEFRISELQALLPKVRDPELKAYVEKSLKVHEEGSDEITTLLRKFKP